MGNVKDAISKNILFYRKKKKMSQKELAQRIGVNNSAISNWENGINSIDIETLFKVCVELEVSIDAMFGNEIEIVDQPTFSPDTLAVATIYEAADSRTRNKVRCILDMELVPEQQRFNDLLLALPKIKHFKAVVLLSCC